jgi:hypothetical protein
MCMLQFVNEHLQDSRVLLDTASVESGPAHPIWLRDLMELFLAVGLIFLIAFQLLNESVFLAVLFLLLGFDALVEIACKF